MNCPDDLVQKIRNSPILPKPEVKELLYSYDWRSFVGPNLSGKKLQNHSFFFSFFLKKENGLAVFRGKKYPFNVEWTPESGIMLLKSNVEFVPVEASDFRIETLCIDKVFSDLYTKFFPTLETNERKIAEASWERLRTVLENLPKQQRNLTPMKILSFPKQFSPQPAVVPQYQTFRRHSFMLYSTSGINMKRSAISIYMPLHFFIRFCTRCKKTYCITKS